MTIEEAIQHCEEVAAGETEQGKCPACAAEHKQLAEWLRELVAIRAQPHTLDRSRWVGCKECVPPWCKTCIRYDVQNMDTICKFSCINHSKHKPNNFCQSCGRPLTEEAWAELERRINDGTTD